MAYIKGITDQPNEYIRFIDSAPINDSGKFVINKLDYPDSYISDYYTPNFEVTSVATKVKSIIDTSDYCDNMTPLENGSFINLVENSNIPYTNPSTYLLIKGIVLDIFSINYTFQYDTNLETYLSMEDLNNLLSNIEYVIDNLGFDTKYNQIVSYLLDFQNDMSTLKVDLPSVLATSLNIEEDDTNS